MYNNPTARSDGQPWYLNNSLSLSSALQCNFTASAQYCQPPYFCENSLGGTPGVPLTNMMCTRLGNAPHPPPSPPPSPSPPAPPGGWQAAQCNSTMAYPRNYTNATTRVTGIYCSSSDCGSVCSPASSGSTGLKCRYGGLLLGPICSAASNKTQVRRPSLHRHDSVRRLLACSLACQPCESIHHCHLRLQHQRELLLRRRRALRLL